MLICTTLHLNPLNKLFLCLHKPWLKPVLQILRGNFSESNNYPPNKQIIVLRISRKLRWLNRLRLKVSSHVFNDRLHLITELHLFKLRNGDSDSVPCEEEFRLFGFILNFLLFLLRHLFINSANKNCLLCQM